MEEVSQDINEINKLKEQLDTKILKLKEFMIKLQK